MTASREQLEAILQLIAEDIHRTFDDQFLRDMLGPVNYGRLKGIEDVHVTHCLDDYEEAQAETNMPASVERYLDRLNLHLQNHEAQKKMVMRLNANIASYERRRDRLIDQMAYREKNVWDTYDALEPEDKKWCARKPDKRTDTNQPKVFNKAPWSVLFPETPLPMNSALRILIDQLTE